MTAHEYHFITRWQQPAQPDLIFKILDNATDLPRWWPSVYLDVRTLNAGSSDPAPVMLYTKGWLPYTLRWRLRVVDRKPPTRLAVAAEGDFVGEGIWTLTPTPAGTAIEYDWRVRVEKPLLRSLSFLFKPIFAANHRWAMAKGEESLRLELARRAAPSDSARERIPSPPPPTPTSMLGWVNRVVFPRNESSIYLAQP